MGRNQKPMLNIDEIKEFVDKGYTFTDLANHFRTSREMLHEVLPEAMKKQIYDNGKKRFKENKKKFSYRHRLT